MIVFAQVLARLGTGPYEHPHAPTRAARPAPAARQRAISRSRAGGLRRCMHTKWCVLHNLYTPAPRPFVYLSFYAVPRATIYVSRPHFGIGEVDRNIENASLEPEQMKTTEEYFTQRRRPNLYDSETMYLGQYG